MLWTTSDGEQLDAVTWNGTVAGAIELPTGAEPYGMPSPDGRMVLAWPWVIGQHGTVIATVDLGSNLLRDVAWSASGDQLCLITSGPEQGPDGGALRIYTDSPGAPVHLVGTVSIHAGGPSIAGCDPQAHRVVILNVFHEHEGGDGFSFSAVLATWVFNTVTGQVIYQAYYPGTANATTAT